MEITITLAGYTETQASLQNIRTQPWIIIKLVHFSDSLSYLFASLVSFLNLVSFHSRSGQEKDKHMK